MRGTHLMTGYYGIRTSVPAQFWVRNDLWEAHLRRLGRLKGRPNLPANGT